MSEVKELQAKYPYLIPVGKFNSRVTAAKNIRIELARAFPGVKFYVRSDRFSGGDSIDVGWTDGPTSEKVRGIIEKYQPGWFDGMTDIYNYTPSAWTTAFGQAKYVSSCRSYSDAVIESVIEQEKEKYGAFDAPTVEGYRNGGSWNTTPMGAAAKGERHWSWQEIISRGLDAYSVSAPASPATTEPA